eukprot:jgi/Bigna1/144806/aug1.91_g19514
MKTGRDGNPGMNSGIITARNARSEQTEVEWSRAAHEATADRRSMVPACLATRCRARGFRGPAIHPSFEGAAIDPLDLIKEINRARTQPKKVAKSICQRLARFKGKNFIAKDDPNRSIVTKEGVAAVKEAIEYLTSIEELPSLEEENIRGLQQAAADHVVDIGSKGRVGHDSSDGTKLSDRANRYGRWTGTVGEVLWFGRTKGRPYTAREVIEDLIIDDGVKSRGHRHNIYNPRFHLAGAQVGDHKTYGTVADVVLAGAFKLDEEKYRKRLKNGPLELEASRRKEVIKTQWSKSIGTCYVCRKDIHGGSVIEKGKFRKYHRECYKCYKCGESLTRKPSRDTKEKGKVRDVCITCWTKDYAPRCDFCKKPITGDLVKVRIGGVSLSFHVKCNKERKQQSSGRVKSPSRSKSPISRSSRPCRRSPVSRKPRRPTTKTAKTSFASAITAKKGIMNAYAELE